MASTNETGNSLQNSSLSWQPFACGIRYGVPGTGLAKFQPDPPSRSISKGIGPTSWISPRDELSEEATTPSLRPSNRVNLTIIAEGVRFQRNAHFQHPVSSRWSHQRAVPARTTRPAAPEECTTGLALDPNRRGSTDTMDTAIPRRRFLQGTAALTLAAGLPAPSRADEPGNMPIVDTHQHLWDLSRFKLPGLKGVP